MNVPKSEGYTYVDYQASCKSLIHIINHLGDDLVGIELGTALGESFFTLLHNCPNIKTLHGIDFFQPYVDSLTYDGTPCHLYDDRKVDMQKKYFYHNLQFTDVGDRGIFHEKDVSDALNDFEEESVDFIFVDTCINYESAKREISSWYKILKPGGIYCGHDWKGSFVQRSVLEFREENKITNKMSVFDNVWMWYK